MQSPLCFQISGVSMLGILKSPELYLLPCDLDLSAEFPLSLVPADTQKAASIVLPGFTKVLHVGRSANVAQVLPSVVTLVAVFMVNLGRPLASHVRPGEAVSKVPCPLNLDVDIAVLQKTSDSARPNTPACWFDPGKVARERVIRENASELINVH